MKKVKAEDLLRKYEAGDANDEERAIVESWYLEQEIVANPEPEVLLEDHFIIKDTFLRHINRKATKLIAGRRIAAAAVVCIGLVVSLYLYDQTNKDHTSVNFASLSTDIAPGGNRATLTLADGRTIPLNENKEGIIIAADKIVYSDGGIVSAERVDASRAVNTISTPRGGQYQVVLPDGTKVWLNAASSLTYPASFTGAERKVELKGEGYFEVAKNDKQPFIVTSEGQEVKVLGTHFNINAYTDEPIVKTTLLEGAVQVSATASPVQSRISSVKLSPGEQSILLANDRIQVHTVDAETVIAWKNGYFIFNDESLESIMRKVAKWYDVEVSYKTDLRDLKFGGIVSRANPISDVLRLMERTGKVHFKVENKEITVLP